LFCFFVAFHPEHEIPHHLLRKPTVSSQVPEKLRFSQDDYLHWRNSFRHLVNPARTQQVFFAKQLPSSEIVAPLSLADLAHVIKVAIGRGPGNDPEKAGRAAAV